MVFIFHLKRWITSPFRFVGYIIGLFWGEFLDGYTEGKEFDSQTIKYYDVWLKEVPDERKVNLIKELRKYLGTDTLKLNNANKSITNAPCWLLEQVEARKAKKVNQQVGYVDIFPSSSQRK